MLKKTIKYVNFDGVEESVDAYFNLTKTECVDLNLEFEEEGGLIGKIKKLIKNTKLTDIEFCSALQQITRKYLEFRFGQRFSAISSNDIRNVFKRICEDEMPSEVSYAVDDLTAMFVRTDYIRYAHDSIDSQLYPPTEHQAALVKNERKSLSDMILKSIEVFESSEERGEE